MPKADFIWKASNYKAKYVKTTTKYHLQISEASDFSSLSVDTSDLIVTSLSHINPLKGETKYFWRVRASNEGNYSEWSEVWSFTTLPLPSKPLLVFPLNNEINVSLKSKLKWEQTALANKYEVQVATEIDFKNIVFEKISVLNTVTTIELEPQTTYFWRVRGINDGGVGQWSEIWKFTTTIAGLVTSEIPFLTIEYFPNPFDKEIIFNIDLRESHYIRLDITDALGIGFINLVSGFYESGSIKINWKPVGIPSGIYYYILRTNEGVKSGCINYIK
jgi:hypothetical protein